MARKAYKTVVTRKNDPTFVKLFDERKSAEEFFGPNWDKDGYVITTLEKKTETFYVAVSEMDGMAIDQTENGAKLNTTAEGGLDEDA